MADELTLSRYEVVAMRVQSSTQISARASAIVARLATPTVEGGRATVVTMKAQPRVANKMITIVEIAKRELASKGLDAYQYNALSSELKEIEGARKPDAAEEPVAEVDSDDAFEEMGSVAALAPKKRAIPALTIYLANAPVKELRLQFG